MMTAVIYIITLLCGIVKRPGVKGTILSACSTNKPGIDSETHPQPHATSSQEPMTNKDGRTGELDLKGPQKTI